MRSIKQNLSKYILFVVLLITATFAVASTEFKVANTGHVEAYFLGSSAGFENKFTINFDGVSSTPVNSPAWLSNHQPIGSYFDFGAYTAGTQLVFVDNVVETNNWWYSHQPFNDDGIKHFMSHQIYMQDMTPALIVRWEDMYGGGDNDFNDHVLLVTNVMPAVPEPSTLAMLLLGLGLIPLIKRKS